MLSNQNKYAVWRPGVSPKLMDDSMIEDIKQLFFDQTGEVYTAASIRTLPIPEWNGNLNLIDENGLLRGIFLASRFGTTRARIVAFVIEDNYTGMGYGSQAWDIFRDLLREEGIEEVQLEVKANNSGAIKFYQQRGLHIVEELKGYYKSGLGYVMRGLI